tara:strand:+ start:4698 stop:4880 length:183 start_codon:yes stop_codon:yes gene_type:complete
VLHIPLLSAQGGLDPPDPLPDEVWRLLGEIPKSGLGGLLKRTYSKDRLRMEVESPDLWTV